MKSRSKHNKGKRFEKYLHEYFKANLDGYSHGTKGSGNGLDKSDINLPQYNIKIEAKNQQTTKLSEWWEQTKSQVFNETPVLAIRNPRYAEFQDTLIILSLEDFTELLKNSKEEVVVEHELSYSQKSALENLKSAVTRVIKELSI